MILLVVTFKKSVCSNTHLLSWEEIQSPQWLEQGSSLVWELTYFSEQQGIFDNPN